MNAPKSISKQQVTRLAERKSRETNAELRAIGCPFEWTDLRSGVWLDGYKAGLAFAGEVVRS